MLKKHMPVHVIISGDVDYSEHHNHADKVRIFDAILDAARDIDLRLSFYFTAKEAVQVGACVRRLAEHGHEIGCHGLTHDDEEEYNRLPYEKQFEYLSEATEILRSIIGKEISSFRAPRVKVSAPTYRVLAELGYLTDSSVCSQRLDLISSNLFNMRWLFAPRMPYRPGLQNPFIRGKGSILIVPVSAFVVPFISSSLYVFGSGFMQQFFRVLYAEAVLTGKPIVYLYHPYEFIAEIPGKRRYTLNVRVHGLRSRRFLCRGTPEEKFKQNTALWRYMNAFPIILPKIWTTG